MGDDLQTQKERLEATKNGAALALEELEMERLETARKDAALALKKIEDEQARRVRYDGKLKDDELTARFQFRKSEYLRACETVAEKLEAYRETREKLLVLAGELNSAYLEGTQAWMALNNLSDRLGLKNEFAQLPNMTIVFWNDSNMRIDTDLHLVRAHRRG